MLLVRPDLTRSVPMQNKKEYQRNYKAQLYKTRREQGLCTECGAAANGKAKCDVCTAQGAIRQKKRYEKAKQKGKCTSCHAPAAEGKTRCRPCIDRASKERLAYYHAVKYNGGAICVGCGETEVSVLQVDHINRGGGKHIRAVGAARWYRWLIKNNFPPGFRILCANCNWRAHRGIPFPNDKTSPSSETPNDVN
jgi:hypothetical protein